MLLRHEHHRSTGDVDGDAGLCGPLPLKPTSGSGSSASMGHLLGPGLPGSCVHPWRDRGTRRPSSSWRGKSTGGFPGGKAWPGAAERPVGGGNPDAQGCREKSPGRGTCCPVGHAGKHPRDRCPEPISRARKRWGGGAASGRSENSGRLAPQQRARSARPSGRGCNLRWRNSPWQPFLPSSVRSLDSYS